MKQYDAHYLTKTPLSRNEVIWTPTMLEVWHSVTGCHNMYDGFRHTMLDILYETV